MSVAACESLMNDLFRKERDLWEKTERIFMFCWDVFRGSWVYLGEYLYDC